MALAGNKCDLPAEQQRIDQQRSIAFAQQHHMIWAEVSAKEGTGIEAMFKTVAEKVWAIKQGNNLERTASNAY
jgi:GTPase SAR1 family protein